MGSSSSGSSFSASNALASAEDLDSTPAVTINILPVISDGSARKIDSNFIINATVDDINLNDGDSISVFAVIEFGSTVAMGSDGNSNYTITVAESAIIDERGGLRTVTFVTADSYGEIVSADFLELQLKLTKPVHSQWLPLQA